MKTIKLFHYSAALAIAVCFGACSPAESAEFDIDIQFRTIYDDNILNYSDADLELINDPSAPDNKFGIESKDDFIINPGLDVVYKSIIAGHSLHLGLEADYYYYQKNDIKRYFRLKSYFRRYFMRGSYFQGSFLYLPDYYYRNSYASSEGYLEAEFDKISLTAKLALQMKKDIQVNAHYEYSNKDFISVFDERDLNQHDFGGDVIYRPVRLWKGWMSYTFSHAISAGADNPDYVRDTSFDSNLFTLGSRFYLKGVGRKGFQMAGRVSYKKVYYQTTKVTSEDRYRLGREDNRWYFNLMIIHEITGALEAGLTYRHYLKKVDLPAEYLIEILESSSNSIYLTLEYSL